MGKSRGVAVCVRMRDIGPYLVLDRFFFLSSLFFYVWFAYSPLTGCVKRELYVSFIVAFVVLIHSLD